MVRSEQAYDVFGDAELLSIVAPEGKLFRDVFVELVLVDDVLELVLVVAWQRLYTESLGRPLIERILVAGLLVDSSLDGGVSSAKSLSLSACSHQDTVCYI